MAFFPLQKRKLECTTWRSNSIENWKIERKLKESETRHFLEQAIIFFTLFPSHIWFSLTKIEQATGCIWFCIIEILLEKPIRTHALKSPERFLFTQEYLKDAFRGMMKHVVRESRFLGACESSHSSYCAAKRVATWSATGLFFMESKAGKPALIRSLYVRVDAFIRTSSVAAATWHWLLSCTMGDVGIEVSEGEYYRIIFLACSKINSQHQSIDMSFIGLMSHFSFRIWQIFLLNA